MARDDSDCLSTFTEHLTVARMFCRNTAKLSYLTCSALLVVEGRLKILVTWQAYTGNRWQFFISWRLYLLSTCYIALAQRELVLN